MNVTEKLNMLTHCGDDTVIQFGFVYKYFMFIIGDSISGVYNFLWKMVWGFGEVWFGVFLWFWGGSLPASEFLEAFFLAVSEKNYYLNSYLQDTNCSLATKNTVVHFAAELLQPLQYLLKQ